MQNQRPLIRAEFYHLTLKSKSASRGLTQGAYQKSGHSRMSLAIFADERAPWRSEGVRVNAIPTQFGVHIKFSLGRIVDRDLLAPGGHHGGKVRLGLRNMTFTPERSGYKRQKHACNQEATA
jgi:hypothetical protein